MGSGETAPTMVTTHREVVARFGDAAPRAVLLDTPYGFQENAAEITQRAIEYFGHRVQLAIEAAGFLGPLAVDPGQRTPLAETAALSRLRTADLIFAGPGSPSYALSVWRPSLVPETLAGKLTEGGAVVFASAAALTLGRFSVPVYEIYKVGQPIHWLEGLDLLGSIGFPGACAVIPHYDNAEGGTHDTRFCYLGERRLDAMEALLPDDGWVLGIDEHTALVVDLDAREAIVTGRGIVIVRRRGASQQFPAGERLSLDALLTVARGTCGPAGHRTEPVATARQRLATRGDDALRTEAVTPAVGGGAPGAGLRGGARRAVRRRRGRGHPASRPGDPGVGHRQPPDGRSRSGAGRPALADSPARRGGGRRAPRPARASGSARREPPHPAAGSFARPGRGSWPIGSARNWSPRGSSCTTRPPARSGSCARNAAASKTRL